MIRRDRPEIQQKTLDFEPGAKTCPMCGSLARRFGRPPGSIWTCLAPSCGIEFTPIVAPTPKPRGGAK
jgi:ribosomal protein L37AE/L43A